MANELGDPMMICMARSLAEFIGSGLAPSVDNSRVRMFASPGQQSAALLQLCNTGRCGSCRCQKLAQCCGDRCRAPLLAMPSARVPAPAPAVAAAPVKPQTSSEWNAPHRALRRLRDRRAAVPAGCGCSPLMPIRAIINPCDRAERNSACADLIQQHPLVARRARLLRGEDAHLSRRHHGGQRVGPASAAVYNHVRHAP